MPKEIQELLAQVLTLVVIALLSLAADALRKWLRQRFSHEQLATAMDVARIAAGAVEQMYRRATGVDPKAKFDQAMQHVRALGEQKGLKLTDDQWRALLEAAVREINATKDLARPPQVQGATDTRTTGGEAA